MTDTDGTTELPKRRMGTFYFLDRAAYALVMLRELTSFFIYPYLLIFITLLFKLIQGPAQFDAFMAFLGTTPMLILHVVAFVMAIYHMVTFFNLAPQVMVIRKGEEKLPEYMITAPHYFAWGVFSAAIFVLALKV